MAEDTTAAAPAPAAAAAPAAPAPAEPTTETPAAEPSQPAEAAPPAEPEADPDEKPVTFRDRLALRQREQAIAAREAEIADKLKHAETASSRLAELEQLAKMDRVGLLEALGITWEDVAKDVAAGRQRMDPAAKQALEEVQRLKKEREAEKAERAKAEIEAGVHRFKGAIAETIKAGGDKYEFLAAKGSAGVEDVKDAALAYWQKHGKGPDLAKVAEQVDRHYEQEWEAGLKTKRAQAKLKPPAPAPATPAKPGAPATKTLTNTMDGKPPPAKPEQGNPRSSHEQTLRDLEEIQKARGARG